MVELSVLAELQSRRDVELGQVTGHPSPMTSSHFPTLTCSSTLQHGVHSVHNENSGCRNHIHFVGIPDIFHSLMFSGIAQWKLPLGGRLTCQACRGYIFPGS